jgi:hypothetical protein
MKRKIGEQESTLDGAFKKQFYVDVNDRFI